MLTSLVGLMTPNSSILIGTTSNAIPRSSQPVPYVQASRRRALLNVAALGAVCEMEDLTAPPRHPKLDAIGYVHQSTPAELDAARADRRAMQSDSGFAFGIVAPEVALAERRKMLESGRSHFYLEEFADLSDGRRVLLRDDRGWSGWPANPPDSPWKVTNGRELTKAVILVLDPDDHEFWNEYWMKWVIERLCFLGIEVDPVSVHVAPFRVEFGPRVQHQLRQRKSDG